MKKIKMICGIAFLCSLVLSGIFWFTQVRKSDRIGPTISMEEQELTVKLDATEADFLKGVTAKDDKDGDVTDSLVVETVSEFLSGGRRRVVYAAIDSHNNVSRASRIVKYDNYESPKVSLDAPFTFGSMNSSDDSVLTQNIQVNDVIDGDISDQVRFLTSTSVNLYYEGDYPVKFSVENSAGDKVSFGATIHVYDSEAKSSTPFIHLKKYLVYTKVGKKLNPKSYIDAVCMGVDFDVDDPKSDIDEKLVKITDDTDYDTPGAYEITYKVKSGKSKTGVVRLIVIVTE